MFRQEALEELVAVEDDLVKRAAPIAEYTDTSVFVPERVENGAEAPPEWFGLNPEDGEDSAEEIDSSDEGEEEEGEDAEPADGVAGQPQPDRSSSTTSRASASPAAGGGQAGTR